MLSGARLRTHAADAPRVRQPRVRPARQAAAGVGVGEQPLVAQSAVRPPPRAPAAHALAHPEGGGAEPTGRRQHRRLQQVLAQVLAGGGASGHGQASAVGASHEVSEAAAIHFTTVAAPR